MVSKNRKKLSVAAAVLSLVLLTTACRGTEMPYDQHDPFEIGKEQDEDISKKLFGLGEHHHDETDDEPDVVMNGPDIPPEGTSYEEWKGIKYTTDTSFNLRSFWAMRGYDSNDLAREGIVMYPEAIEDARLEIIDAKVEPIGGEMKLRSGGSVDISIELRWTGTMSGIFNNSAPSWYIQWSENVPHPCDAYTGTSLLNYTDKETEDDRDTSISPGQAIASSMTESDVTWQGRTYRLFAKSDTRNSSSSDWSLYDLDDGKTRFTCPASVDTTLTFRVPADYDGLVLAICKDITDQREYSIDQNGNYIHYSDLYADVLTTRNGIRQSADDYYFVRVSDLLELFSE